MQIYATRYISLCKMYAAMYINLCTFLGEQGWRSGESTRLPPMWPGFNSRTLRHMWVEFVVGSRPCSKRFFSRYSGFPLSSKTNISKFQFDLESEGHRFVSRNRLLSVTLVNKVELFINLCTFMQQCTLIYAHLCTLLLSWLFCVGYGRQTIKLLHAVEMVHYVE